MALEITDTIILKSFPYGETSKIARCYTRDFGKVSLIGKGVRKGKTLRSGYLEPLNHLSLSFYKNPRRELQIFSKAEFKNVLSALKGDVKKITYGFAIVELVDKGVTGEEPHEELFDLLVDTLNAINSATGNINVIFWYFEMKFLSLLGFRPNLSTCPDCESILNGAVFSHERGELVCSNCLINGERKVSSRTITFLKTLKHGSVIDAINLKLKPGDRSEIGGFLDRYLRHHIDTIRNIKSLKIMERVLA